MRLSKLLKDRLGVVDHAQLTWLLVRGAVVLDEAYRLNRPRVRPIRHLANASMILPLRTFTALQLIVLVGKTRGTAIRVVLILLCSIIGTNGGKIGWADQNTPTGLIEWLVLQTAHALRRLELRCDAGLHVRLRSCLHLLLLRLLLLVVLAA